MANIDTIQSIPGIHLRGMEVFSGSQTLRRCFESANHHVVSIDNKKYRDSAPDTIIMDFMDFDYTIYPKHYFDFIHFGLPCDAFSKASGGFHFDGNWKPKTDFAYLSIELMLKSIQMTKYFKNAIFFFENPTGGLVNHPIFKEFILSSGLQVIRIHLGQYGFKTSKQTDIITNSNLLWVDNRMYRKNGVYSKVKFDNLSDNQRHTYPIAFCEKIVNFTEHTFFFNNTSKS